MNDTKIRGLTQKDILFLSVSFFIVVAAWIGFNLYHVWATSTIPPDVQSHLTPIEPTFDTKTLNELKSRQAVTPVYELSGEVSTPAAVTTPTNTPSPTETADEETEEEPDETVTPTP